MLMRIFVQGVFTDVFVSFLIKGHTHFDPDQVFSRVATQLKVTDAFGPSQFKDVLKNVSVRLFVNA